MEKAPHQYLTIAQADQLLAFQFQKDPYTKWINGTVTDEIKTKALYVATAIFDGLPWKGYRRFEGQEHSFPRTLVRDFFDELSPHARDRLLLDTTVGTLPYAVAMGLAITAADLAQNLADGTDEEDILSLGFSKIDIGSLSVDIANQFSGDISSLSVDAQTWIKPCSLISKTGRGVSTFRII